MRVWHIGCASAFQAEQAGSSPATRSNFMKDDLVFRLRKRAEIRRNITTRKSVQEGQPDRIADLLEEAAIALEELQKIIEEKSRV
jgi:hypothetical protein